MKLRTAYVQIEFGRRLSGISGALRGQARAGRGLAVPMEFFVVHMDPMDDDADVRFVRPRTVFARPKIGKYFKARLIASVPELRRFDVLFVRYPTAVDVDPTALVRGSHPAIVSVHHTNEVAEILSASRSLGTLARAGIEWIGGRRVLARVDGIVGVTDEIRAYEVGRASRDVPSAAIANGVDVARLPLSGFAPYDGNELRMLFVASSYAAWHGRERLIESLRAYRGSRRIVLDVVGGGTREAPGTTQSVGSANLHYHGLLSGKEFDRVFENVSVAVSSLSMHEAGLQQGCVLKTREYLSRGVPFVYAYDDPDVAMDAPFALQFPNDKSLLPIERIIEFAERCAGTPDLAQTMRTYAQANVDWAVKVRAYAEFAERVYAMRRPA